MRGELFPGGRLHTKQRIWNILASTVVILVGFGASAGSPLIPAKSPASIERTPQRVARGKYLVESLAHCFRCHSENDFQYLNGQAPPEKKAGGQVILAEEFSDPPPASMVCPNISPDRETGAGTWTDEDFVRAIRDGIGHDGRKLHSMMPYWTLRALTDEDMSSIIAYVRSIPAVHHPLPKRSLAHEPVILETPPVRTPEAPAGSSEQVRHGEYLAHIGNCAGCHNGRTPDRKPVPGLEYAGGRVLRGRWGVVTSANITPDASGIGYYDEQKFIEVMRTGHVGARKLNPIMPWADFRNLTDSDLKALFAYLRSVPSVQHRVDNTEPPTFCSKCKNLHGLGDRN
jgi:mono/diheme cytochrome c family protein